MSTCPKWLGGTSRTGLVSRPPSALCVPQIVYRDDSLKDTPSDNASCSAWSNATHLHSSRSAFLLFVLGYLNVVLWYTLELVKDKLFNLVGNITLHRDQVLAAWCLRDGAACGKLLAKVLGHFLQLQPERLQSRDLGYKLALVTLDTFDDDSGFRSAGGLSFFGARCLGCLLLVIFLCACAGFYREGGQGCGGRFWRVVSVPLRPERWQETSLGWQKAGWGTFRIEASMQIRMAALDPLFAFAFGPSEFTELRH